MKLKIVGPSTREDEMKERFVGVFWGLVLVVCGAVALLGNIHVLRIDDPYIGMAVTGGMSVLFFASYFLSGTKRWGWLFPACILAGATLTIALSLANGFPEGLTAAPVMLGIAAPFLAAYFQVPNGRRWALIPFCALVVLTIVIALSDSVSGDWMGTLVLLALGLPFLVTYLMNREHRWALIVGGILAGLSLIPLLTAVFSDEYAGVAVLALFSIAFGTVYFLKPRHWWALIPAGLFLSSMVSVLLTDTPLALHSSSGVVERVVGGVFFAGFALTFLVLWLRRASIRTAWAVYPALIFGALAAITIIGGENWVNNGWPVILIAIGLLVLFRNYRRNLA
jgi:hypothetical protein